MEASLPAYFSELLKLFRERAGVSQNGLADRSGKDPGTINRLESGKRLPSNREQILALADALDLGSADADRLASAAGFLPRSYDAIDVGDSDLRLVAELLTDQTLRPDELRDLRLQIRLAARRFRDVVIYDDRTIL